MLTAGKNEHEWSTDVLEQQTTIQGKKNKKKNLWIEKKRLTSINSMFGYSHTHTNK